MPRLAQSRCAGPTRRREFLRLGLTGFASLSLADLFRMRTASAAPPPARRTSVLVVWLHGGASHLETYDPKPDAPSEYRGPFDPIATRVPGLNYCELLPRQAAIADKVTVLRSLVHTGFCHDDGPQQIFTGHPIQGRRLKPDNPDLLSIANFLRTDPDRDLPNYVGVGPIPYLGSAYLGPAHEPFAVHGDPNAPTFEVPNIGLKDEEQARRLSQRIGLRVSLDRLRREIDRGGNMEAMDRFEAQAWNVLTGAAARRAFDLGQESDATRERYGRNAWGQQCLLGRRLIEAGVELVAVTLNGPLCGRVQNWDDHAVNHHVFDGMKYRTPFFDQAVTTLIEEVHERGLDKETLVVIGGDFGRTPKISYAPSSGGGVASGPTGTMQPGRDHWPSAMSFVFSGGGIPVGQVIGATDARGEHATQRRLGVQDFVATLYRHLGIDADRVQLLNFSGRPVPILQDGKAIPELLPRGVT
ncbi:MAG: DUF1501 domain-containing protein [Planctomycetales bacterium]